MKTPAIIFALTFISSIAFAQTHVSKVTNPAVGSGAAATASYAATGKAIVPSDTIKAKPQQKANLVGAALPGGQVISAAKKNVGKQTQGTTFGEKVNQGLHSACSSVANVTAKTDNPLYENNGSAKENPLHKSEAKVASPGTPIGGIIVKGGKN